MDDPLGNWAIGNVTAIEPINSYWGKTFLVKTIGGPCYILKEKSNVSQIEKESYLLSSLYKVGAPVAVPIRTIDAMWYAQTEGKIFCLYPRLIGDVITEHYAGDAAVRAAALGKAIAFLHSCFLKCDDGSSYDDIRLIEQIQNWAIPCLRGYKTIFDKDSLEKIWQELEQEMESIYIKLPKQLIHRDLHPANMLFDACKLTGFVDFEMVVRGPRVFDVCYCGTSILVGAFPNAAKMRSWPKLFRSLVKGYQEIQLLTHCELSALYGTLAAIELLFAAFSLEIKAEEAAMCNVNILKWLSANKESLSVWDSENRPGFVSGATTAG